MKPTTIFLTEQERESLRSMATAYGITVQRGAHAGKGNVSGLVAAIANGWITLSVHADYYDNVSDKVLVRGITGGKE
jgi:hypothetical protein